MLIIKKSKMKKLKACRKACKKIYELMMSAGEDEHGNVTAYRWDKIHKEILDALKDAGFGTDHLKIVGIDDWEYQLPWPVKRREEA